MQNKIYKMKILNSFNIPKSIFAIGIITLLMNISTVIVFSLSPIYLTTVLGVNISNIGVIEGVIEFISWLTRVFAGIISDILKKRKPLLILAIFMTCIARIIFSFANKITDVFISRSLDRVANGLQASPRDALIGDLTQKKQRGAAYGMRQSLGMLGSALGAIITFVVLYDQSDNFSTVFTIATIPPILALFIIMFAIHEKQSYPAQDNITKQKRFNITQVQTLKTQYWKLLLLGFIFMLSNYSGAFIILHGKSIVNLNTIAPAIMIVQNICAMAVAYPVGKTFDRFNHKILIFLGFCTVIIANIIFTQSNSIYTILLGSAIWGIQMGVNQSFLNAKLSSLTTKKNRGTGFGIFYITLGSGILISNTIVGRITDIFGFHSSFYYSMMMACIAALSVPLLIENSYKDIKC